MGLPLACLVALCLALSSARGTELHRGEGQRAGSCSAPRWGILQPPPCSSGEGGKGQGLSSKVVTRPECVSSGHGRWHCPGWAVVCDRGRGQAETALSAQGVTSAGAGDAGWGRLSQWAG